MKLFSKFKNIDNRNNNQLFPFLRKRQKYKSKKPALLLFNLIFVLTNDDSNDEDAVGSGLWGKVVVGVLGGEVVGSGLWT